VGTTDESQAAAAPGGGGPPAQTPSPFGAGCGGGGGQVGGGGFGGVVPNLNGPFVIGGVYTVALIVDGKTVESKTLRVNDDPDVALTSAERKRMFDQAMEIHALQPRITEAGTAYTSLARQMTELGTTIGGRTDVPADVKASFDAVKKDLDALATKLATPQGGRGGGGGGGRGNNESLAARVAQAKNGLTAGMSPGDQTARAYTEVKAQTPKAIVEINAVIAKATTLSGTLATYNLTLTVPQPVRAPDAAPAGKRASSHQRQ
jgi:hypothetical protein